MSETKTTGEHQGGTKAERTRRRISDAAARVLARRGYASAKLPEIASEAGLQTAAIYYHFASREDLIQSVLSEGTTLILTHVRATLDALPQATGPIDRIMEAISAHLHAMLGTTDHTLAAMRNSRQLPADLKGTIREAEEEYGILWRDLIDHAHTAGRLRPDADPYLSRMLILGALNFAAEWWNPEQLTVETVVETTQGIVRRGLERRPPRPAAPLFLEPSA